MPNAIHPTLTQSFIFMGTKIDLNFQKLVPIASYAALHYTNELEININLIQTMVFYYTELMIQHLTRRH